MLHVVGNAVACPHWPGSLALHFEFEAGKSRTHRFLLKQCTKNTHILVTNIFVNPNQLSQAARTSRC